MRSSFMFGFLDEIEKTALDLESAKKMTEASVKPYLVRRGRATDSGIRLRAVDPATGKPMEGPYFPRRMGSPEGPLMASPSPKTGSRPLIFARGKRLSSLSENVGSSRGFTPRQKEMHKRIILGHEGSEVKHLKKYSPEFASRFGHASPKVLVEESNMIANMPKEFSPVKRRIRQMRQGPEAGGDVKEMASMVRGVGGKPGYVHGRRYSRHAKKRIAEIVERKMGEEKSRALERQKALEAKKAAPPRDVNKELREKALKTGISVAKKAGGKLKGWWEKRKAKKGL